MSWSRKSLPSSGKKPSKIARSLGPAGIVQGPAIVNTDPCFMGLEILPAQEPDIICRHHRQVMLNCEFHRVMDIGGLAIAAGTLQFQVKPIWEQTLPEICAVSCFIPALCQQMLADVAVTTGG